MRALSVGKGRQHKSSVLQLRRLMMIDDADDALEGLARETRQGMCS